MDRQFEIIDAFVDGERVDAAAFKRALSDEAGRDYLVDVWLLREGVQEDMAVDTAAPAPKPAGRRMQSWMIAAAVATVSVAGGYLAGYRTATVVAPSTADQPSAVTNAAPPSAGEFPVPAPTRVIQVEFAPDPASRGGN